MEKSSDLQNFPRRDRELREALIGDDEVPAFGEDDG